MVMFREIESDTLDYFSQGLMTVFDWFDFTVACN